jgi:PAS domain S-box-containing protein
VEDIDAIVWEADAVTWQFTFVSRQAERILGYPVDRWLSTPNFWVETLHLADRATAVQFCAAATAQGRDHMFEYRAVAKDGRIVWLRDIVRVICGPDGRAQRLRGIMIDVTAQKEIERELLYKKSLLEVQSEASVLGILVVSAEGTMVSFNRRFVEMWRLPPEVVNSRSDDAALRAVTDQLTAPQEYMARVAHLYSHPEERSRDEIILKDGRIFDRYSESVYSDGTYDGRVWFFQDVTQERQAERRKDEFIAMLGHELRNPLAPMLSAVQLLRLPGLPLEKQARA